MNRDRSHGIGDRTVEVRSTVVIFVSGSRSTHMPDRVGGDGLISNDSFI